MTDRAVVCAVIYLTSSRLHPCNHRRIMWAKAGFTFVSRVVFPGETLESDSAICFDTSDLRRLLRYRLEVLEAALLELARLKGEAAQST